MVDGCLEEQVELYTTECSIGFVCFRLKHQINVSLNANSLIKNCASSLLRLPFNNEGLLRVHRSITKCIKSKTKYFLSV